jgi:tetratricopeptide (TPR) repeat protein
MNPQNPNLPTVSFSKVIRQYIKVGLGLGIFGFCCPPTTAQLMTHTLGGGPSGDEVLVRLIEDAERALSNDEYNVAIQRCTTVLKSTVDKRFTVPAYCMRSNTYARKYQSQQAMNDAESAVRVSPYSPSGYVARANVNAALGKYQLATADLDKAIYLAPRYESVLNAMAWFKAVCPETAYRDGKKAVELGKRACVITEWRRSTYLDTLAAAYAECGDFDQAIKYENQAISKKNPGFSPKEKKWVAEDQQKHLQFFQSHKAYRDDFKWHH